MAREPGESWESYAERRIRQAQAAGEFAALPGFGQPIPHIDEPWDENSWVKQKLRDERINALPPILQARLDRERTLDAIRRIDSEAEVRRQLIALNARTAQAHFSSEPGPNSGVLPVDVEEEIAAWRVSRG